MTNPCSICHPIGIPHGATLSFCERHMEELQAVLDRDSMATFLDDPESVCFEVQTSLNTETGESTITAASIYPRAN